jgi:signal transduction histidine kinase
VRCPLAFIAHELRKPLAAALDSVHAVRLAPDDARTVDQMCHRIERRLRQMAALVEDLLEWSRADLGKLGIRRQPLDLGSLVRSAVEARHRPSGLKVTPGFTATAPSLKVRPLKARSSWPVAVSQSRTV